MARNNFTGGFIKVHRQILDWEWYGDQNTKELFIHLLLTANIREDRWMGVEIPRGSRVASIPTLAAELNSTNRKIRTALDHLEATGEVTRTKYPKFTVISVVCWDKYQSERQGKRQSSDTQLDRQATGDRQQNKNIKNIKEEKNSASHAPAPPLMGGRSPEEYERWRHQ